MGARFDWRRGGRGEAGASGPRAFPGLYPLWPTKAREVARPLQVPWAWRLLAMTMAGARAAAFGESGGRLCWKRGRSLPPMRWMRGRRRLCPCCKEGRRPWSDLLEPYGLSGTWRPYHGLWGGGATSGGRLTVYLRGYTIEGEGIDVER